jgi:hypothetical protein
MRELGKSVLTCFLAFASSWAMAQQTAFVATWGASPQAGGPNPAESLDKIEGQTVRERVRVSVGGRRRLLELLSSLGEIESFHSRQPAQ